MRRIVNVAEDMIVGLVNERLSALEEGRVVRNNQKENVQKLKKLGDGNSLLLLLLRKELNEQKCNGGGCVAGLKFLV